MELGEETMKLAETMRYRTQTQLEICDKGERWKYSADQSVSGERKKIICVTDG